MGLQNGALRNGGLRNLTEIGAIPDSAILQVDITQESGLSDGESLTTLTDFIASNDLTGNAAYRTNVQNGNPVARYDSTDDNHYRTASNFSTLSQPLTQIAVVVDAAQSGDEGIVTRASSNDSALLTSWSSNTSSWRLFAGSSLAGGTTSPPLILTAIYNGSSSEIRENGTSTGTGNAGTASMESICVGATNGADGGTWFLGGDIGEVLVYDADLSATGDLGSEEQRLADKWGITI